MGLFYFYFHKQRKWNLLFNQCNLVFTVTEAVIWVSFDIHCKFNNTVLTECKIKLSQKTLLSYAYSVWKQINTPANRQNKIN